ncbi:MAG: transcription elongation factor GreA [Clostridia bacterium]|nr:transcription elongation factor GreA [Clostridia bacterium]
MANENQRLYTQQGYNELIEELKYLKGEKRDQIKQDLEAARSFGDLSENAEYDAARNEQAKVETRIKELEDMIENAVVIDESQIDSSIVSLGSVVKAYDVEFDEEITYNVVGSNEANPFEGKISDQSPIGRAIIGAKAGDEVTIDAPGGSMHIKILEVSRA